MIVRRSATAGSSASIVAAGDGWSIEGYLARFDEVYRGAYDREYGRYDEQLAPEVFTVSLRERAPVMLYDHGADAFPSRVPIGVWDDIRPDARGLFGRGRLFRNGLVGPIRDAIAGGAVTGQSVQFMPEIDEVQDRPGRVPLVIRRRAVLLEAGPVLMPAYRTTTVGVRDDAATLDRPVAEVAALRARLHDRRRLCST